jgi:hypothetical protein
MPTYIPILTNPSIRASHSDLIDFKWRNDGVSASFVVPGDQDQALRVRFDCQCIVRLLDEMPLSTEPEDSPVEGLVSDHFAYVVEGARFWSDQSEAFKAVFPTAKHFRFVTGWTCLDVIASVEPDFRLVPSNA